MKKNECKLKKNMSFILTWKCLKMKTKFEIYLSSYFIYISTFMPPGIRQNYSRVHVIKRDLIQSYVESPYIARKLQKRKKKKQKRHKN